MSHQNDLLEDRQTRLLLFGVPQILFVGGFFFGSVLRGVVWTLALTWLGAACLYNAMRCGRLHCFLTGPFYLLSAIVVVLYHIGFISLGSQGWLIIGLGIVLIGNLLTFVPEQMGRKYQSM